MRPFVKAAKVTCYFGLIGPVAGALCVFLPFMLKGVNPGPVGWVSAWFAGVIPALVAGAIYSCWLYARSPAAPPSWPQRTLFGALSGAGAMVLLLGAAFLISPYVEAGHVTPTMIDALWYFGIASTLGALSGGISALCLTRRLYAPVAF